MRFLTQHSSFSGLRSSIIMHPSGFYLKDISHQSTWFYPYRETRPYRDPDHSTHKLKMFLNVYKWLCMGKQCWITQKLIENCNYRNKTINVFSVLTIIVKYFKNLASALQPSHFVIVYSLSSQCLCVIFM